MSEQKVVLNGESSSPIVVSRSVYRGVERLDIRRYYYATGDGELRPTKKGVSLPIESGLAAQAVQVLQAMLNGSD
jgi:hypothetical protein